MQIPDWIDLGAWNGFVEMRKSIKRPMTVRAMEIVIHKLDEMKQKGHDPNACLDQSTLHNWQSVYCVKAEDVPNLKREYMTSLDGPMTPEQKAASDEVRRRLFPLRRVA
jgi:hypothetical protein